LISLEEQDLVRFKKELWTMGAAEREVKGRCFSSMVIDASFRPKASGVGASWDSRINRFTYRFVKADAVGASLLN
jgi:DNA replication ATP-dependent helicase Dna2